MVRRFRCKCTYDGKQNMHRNANFAPSLSEITITNNMKVPVFCSGGVQISTDLNYESTVRNVLLIKNCNSVEFEANHCYIRNKTIKLVATVESTNGVYKLKIKVADCILTAPGVASAELWQVG